MARHSSHTRSKIVTAAWELFYEHGYDDTTVDDIVERSGTSKGSFAWAGFGAAFGPVILLALFWKRSNKWGAVTGMIAGGAMVFIWKYAIAPLGGLLAIYELLPAFIIGLVVNVVVSLATSAPRKDVVDTFEAIAAIKD